MRGLRGLLVALGLGAALAAPAPADPVMIEDFTMAPETRWRFFADTVMGGVSSGEMRFETEDGRPHVSLTGTVSTENNGGFIQIRHELPAPPPAGATGLRLEVRGNDTRYFVHLRTRGTLLPWLYYQAGFEVTQAWAEVRLPFEAFAPSGRLLRPDLRVETITSVGIVAFGRDHRADISVRSLGFY